MANTTLSFRTHTETAEDFKKQCKKLNLSQTDVLSAFATAVSEHGVTASLSVLAELDAEVDDSDLLMDMPLNSAKSNTVTEEAMELGTILLGTSLTGVKELWAWTDGCIYLVQQGKATPKAKLTMPLFSMLCGQVRENKRVQGYIRMFLGSVAEMDLLEATDHEKVQACRKLLPMLSGAARSGDTQDYLRTVETIAKQLEVT